MLNIMKTTNVIWTVVYTDPSWPNESKYWYSLNDDRTSYDPNGFVIQFTDINEACLWAELRGKTHPYIYQVRELLT